MTVPSFVASVADRYDFVYNPHLMESNENVKHQDRLDGWGQIATFLGRDIRTVQRWERQENLPVHRHPGPRPRVWASRCELNDWWNSRDVLMADSAPSEPAPVPVRRKR